MDVQPEVYAVVRHYRLDKNGRLRRYSRQSGFLDEHNGDEPQTKGGETVVELQDETGHQLAKGFAICSTQDNFCYKIGRELATERARKLLAGHPF